MFVTVKGSFCKGVIKSNAGEFIPRNGRFWADGIGYWELLMEDDSVAIINFIEK